MFFTCSCEIKIFFFIIYGMSVDNYVSCLNPFCPIEMIRNDGGASYVGFSLHLWVNLWVNYKTSCKRFSDSASFPMLR